MTPDEPFDRARRLLAEGRSVAMLTVVGKEGSAPREVGARMLVTGDEEYGTIGGGTVESLAVEAAREVLAGDADPGVRTYDLHPGGNTGMVCGGSMDVFVDRIRGQERLYVAGGGHIAAELAPMATRLGYEVTVVDDREEYVADDRFPTAETVHGDYGDVLRDLPMTDQTAVAVATRSGTFDREAVGAALEGGAGYVGLVASDTKARRVLEGLHEEGHDRADLARVRAPVGLELGGGGPEDVALSILAEMSRDRYDASGDRATRLDVDDLTVVRGGGDLGSGVVYRLHRAGYPVVVTDVDRPTVVRRAVAFASAIYDGEVDVEGVTGRRAEDADEAVGILEDGDVPVLVDPEATVADRLDAGVLVDATMQKGKRDTGTRIGDADVVVGLGPGFRAVSGADGGDAVEASDDAGAGNGAEGDGPGGVEASDDAGTDRDPPDGPIPVDAVVETDRGHRLGRVFYEGTASAYDGEPGEREGYTHERVLRAPAGGTWEPTVEMGELVEAGQVVGHVGDREVTAGIDGLVRGLVHSGVEVDSGFKLGDVDPRGEAVDHTEISDKALCLGGGVLEAVLSLR